MEKKTQNCHRKYFLCALFREFSGMIYVGMEFKLFLIITLFAYGWYSVVDFCRATPQIKEFSYISHFFPGGL